MKQWILLVFISGCGGTLDSIESDEFAATLSEVWCQRLQECDRAYYDNSYESRADCESSEQAIWQETHDYYLDRDCQYTSASGASLYNLFVEMSCAEFYEGTFTDDYDTVWSCGG
jgi:hypothetical protein